ncbi:hypothetical protein BHM04_08125 [Macrococcus sp. IME1552]|nr:sigma factor-like helix-turn-helix DNA-binding protein [Macrococcus sp. IME1552]ATD31157.1 hypothetical protein BHM04_08125 [Macrococcus sp. IME1552]
MSIEDFIDIPKILDINTLKKNSKIMNEVLNENLVGNLRLIYAEDKQKFYIILKELYIRGIGFKSPYANNYLKKVDYDFDYYIKAKINGENFKNIDFKYYGLSFFESDFKINNDHFFDFIPINSLRKFIPNKQKLNLLKNEFIKNGFEIRNNLPVINIKDEKKEVLKIKVDGNVRYNSILDISNTNKKLRKLVEINGDFNEFLNYYFNETEFNNINSQSIKDTVYKYKLVNFDKINEIIDENKKRFINQAIYNQIEHLRLNEILKLLEIEYYYNNLDMYINEIDFSISNINIIQHINKKLDKIDSMDNTLKKMIEQFTEKEIDILYKRTNGDSLQKIGEDYSISRERIRQIEKKARNKLIVQIEKNKFILLLIRHKLYFEKIEGLLDKYQISTKYLDFVKLLFSMDEYTIIENMIINNKLFKQIKEDVEKLKNRTIIYNEDFRIRKIEYFPIYRLLLLEDYKVIGTNKFIKRNISISKKIEYILKLYLEQIENTDEGYVKLKAKLESVFQEDINSNRRALFARVADSQNVIVIDKNTYKYDKLEYVDELLLEEIRNIIDDMLSTKDFTNPKEIFEKSEYLLKSNNINNQYHLYSIIQRFLSDVYIIGKGNTLNIYKSEKDKKDVHEILSQYFNNNKKQDLFIDNIISDLNISNNKIEQFVSKSKEYIWNEKKQLLCIKGFKNEIKYNKFKEIICDCINNEYIITLELFIELYSDKEMEELLEKYGISDQYSLAQLIKKIFSSKINGGKYLLFDNLSEYKSVEDVILDRFKGKVVKEDIIDFQINIGYSEQRIYQKFNNLLGINRFLPYDRNLLINNKRMIIGSEVINNIKIQLEIYFSSNDILTRRSIEDIILPNLDINSDVTYYVISFVAETLGYNLVIAYQGSKYELPIILKDDDKREYDHIISDLIKDKKDILNKNDLIKYLKSNELMNKTTADIYLKLKESEYFSFDIVDNIVYKGD